MPNITTGLTKGQVLAHIRKKMRDRTNGLESTPNGVFRIRVSKVVDETDTFASADDYIEFFEFPSDVFMIGGKVIGGDMEDGGPLFESYVALYNGSSYTDLTNAIAFNNATEAGRTVQLMDIEGGGTFVGSEGDKLRLYIAVEAESPNTTFPKTFTVDVLVYAGKY